jgi:hypothetical protein
MLSTDIRKILAYHEIPPSVSPAVPCGLTDRHGEANSGFLQFCECVYTPSSCDTKKIAPFTKTDRSLLCDSHGTSKYRDCSRRMQTFRCHSGLWRPVVTSCGYLTWFTFTCSHTYTYTVVFPLYMTNRQHINWMVTQNSILLNLQT